MRILGIDPGRHGALALIDTVRATLQVWRMPILERELTTTTKHLVDAHGLADVVRGAHADEAWLEDVWAMEGEGPVGAFSFGNSKGVVEGVLGALGVALRYVPPARWKIDLRVPRNKQLAKARGHALFPGCVGILSSEAKAEAALIALFGALSGGELRQVLSPSICTA